MPVKYSYDIERNVVFVIASGDLSIPEINEYAEKVLADDGIKSGFIEQLDFSQVNDLKFSYAGIKVVRSIFERFKGQKDYKGTVMIAPNDLQYGIARMVMAVFKNYAPIYPVRDSAAAKVALEKLLAD